MSPARVETTTTQRKNSPVSDFETNYELRLTLTKIFWRSSSKFNVKEIGQSNSKYWQLLYGNRQCEWSNSLVTYNSLPTGFSAGLSYYYANDYLFFGAFICSFHAWCRQKNPCQSWIQLCPLTHHDPSNIG